MTPEQRAKLTELAAKLMEEYIAEVDPSTWAGAGAPPGSLPPKAVNCRVLDKKNAATTGGLLKMTADLLRDEKLRDKEDANGVVAADALIRAAEKRAKSIRNKADALAAVMAVSAVVKAKG